MSHHKCGLEANGGRDQARAAVIGIVAGGSALLAIMLAATWIAARLGLVEPGSSADIDLDPWGRLEIPVGAIASLIAGAICRHISRAYRASAMLGLIVFCAGLIEAATIIAHIRSGEVRATPWLVWLAPFIGSCGVLLGGWRPGTRSIRWAPLASIGRTAGLCYAVPVVLLLLTAGLAQFALPGVEGVRESEVVATALALDFTVSFPAAVFLLLVRTRRLRWIALLPTFVVGYAVATAAIPEAHSQMLANVGLLAVPAELLFVTYLLILTRRALAEAPHWPGDFATRFRTTARRLLGSRVPADIVTTEVAILYYAFRRPRPIANPEQVYSVHLTVGYHAVVVGLILVLGVETMVMHFAVQLWNTTAAWVLTGLSLYAAIWFVGDYRAIVARPIRITSTHLELRLGLRWEVDIALPQIQSIDRISPSARLCSKSVCGVALLNQPNVRVVLTEPIELVGMYGLRKAAAELLLRVDDPTRFCENLSSD